MSKEIEVAEWLASETPDLTTGDNLFLINLLETTQEGVCVLFYREVQIEGSFSRELLQILIFYRDYVVANNLRKTIVDLLDGRRGTVDGTWTVSDIIKSEFMGTDPHERNIFSIITEIAYKEA